MVRIKETCGCGAVLDMTGDDWDIAFAQTKFQQAHSNCRPLWKSKTLPTTKAKKVKEQV